MSPSVGNFVHDLVEMAKAMETLPQVQRELDQAKRDVQAHLDTIQRLEQKLMQRDREINDLNSTIRSLEVERDNAQFQVLEEQDKGASALSFIRMVHTEAEKLIQAMNPPAPEPKKDDRPLDSSALQQEGGSATGETNSSQGSGDRPLGSSSAEHVADVHHDYDPKPPEQSVAVEGMTPQGFDGGQPEKPVSHQAEGQSEPDPTQATESSSGNGSTDYRERLFTGKKYSEWPAYVTLDRWITGGGTEENYYR